ncbi:release factor glutamine methyltransferase [Polymorphobacter multimanifer]|uniref:peptide chain release factor N(5)-glutamine methyltransferase n=1 Tax=Polymorphobacter multimanifer TaxID=1070431 RepID=UPI00166F273E|nr:peptide chain release factor N(5)-glutamine methyltransferase [Polymorphobacter multimanifer]GGI92589.1 release factor glutamine methyltransferase [Polymorphobacter multimanifer]
MVREALAMAARRVGRLEAEVLLSHLLACSRGDLVLRPERVVDLGAFEPMLARRELGEPVAYITGEREFWSLPLRVTPDVLIPRPDSETLVEAALQGRFARVLDLGTGSGALLLAVLSERPQATGGGVDASAAALEVARGEAAGLGRGDRAVFRLGDWGAELDERFDLILCNPPYVEADAVLSVEVRDFEPGAALFAGADGLDDYRRLVPQLPGLLAPDGVAVLEIGWKQADAVLALAAAEGLAGEVRQDLAGRDRALVLRTI